MRISEKRSFSQDEELSAKILFSLARNRKWGESHTAYENMFKYLRSEVFGKEGLKLAKNTAEDLFRQGYIIKKPTHYGLQVSLNPRMSKQVKELVKKHIGFDL